MSNPKRQHYVPQVLLRKFAAEAEKMTVRDKHTGQRRPSTVRKIASENYLYSPVIDGERTFALEAWFSSVEGALGQILQEVIEHHIWPVSPDMRSSLIEYISLQWSRTPATRDIHNLLAQDYFGGTLEQKGKAWFMDIMKGNEKVISEEDLEASWNRLRHIDLSAFRYDIRWDNVAAQALEHAEALNKRQLILVECNDWPLLTSDRGVGMMPGSVDGGEFSLGLHNNQGIFFPISRDLVVVINNSEGADFVTNGSVRLAKTSNMCIALCAQRWLYHHPDDCPLVGVDFSQIPSFSPSPKRLRSLMSRG